MKSQGLHALARGIAAVFWLWRNEPGSPLLAENRRETPPCVSMSPLADGVCHVCGAQESGRHDRNCRNFKPKRVRIRPKPLAEADIVVGGEYVPKRGNDRTPNYAVVDTSPAWVTYRRVGSPPNEPAACTTYPDFLSLVARRAN